MLLAPVQGTAKLTGDSCGGVGIIAEVGSPEHRLGKAAGCPDAPDGRLKRMCNIARGSHRSPRLAAPRPRHDRVNGPSIARACAQHLAGCGPCDGIGQNLGKGHAGIDGLGGGMGGAALPGGNIAQRGGSAEVA